LQYQLAPKLPVQEDSLKSGELQGERKFFMFALKENPHGRLLRITEDINGRFNSIIISATASMNSRSCQTK